MLYEEISQKYSEEVENELYDFKDDDYPSDGVTDYERETGFSLVVKWGLYERGKCGRIEIDWDSVREALCGETYEQYKERKYGKDV